MQETAKSIEREAARKIPRLLDDLLDEQGIHLAQEDPHDRGVDFCAHDSRGRKWLFEVKSSSRPSQIDRAANNLRHWLDSGAITVLVVPYMTEAGAETADRYQLNWLDLSGNAHIRANDLLIWVQGRPNKRPIAGRPSSPFAPKSARVARLLLLEPKRWWRQKDLVTATGLDDGNVSRIVRRLDDEFLLDRQEADFRPRDPGLLLDAWKDDYRFDRHHRVTGHLTGNGVELARELQNRLVDKKIHHAFTGLPAAWAYDHFARFRLVSVYVDADPELLAEDLEIRVAAKGANVQLLGPDDDGVFAGEAKQDGLTCVSAVQVYLDLLALPERATDAAEHLRAKQLFRDGAAS